MERVVECFDGVAAKDIGRLILHLGQRDLQVCHTRAILRHDTPWQVSVAFLAVSGIVYRSVRSFRAVRYAITTSPPEGGACGSLVRAGSHVLAALNFYSVAC